MTTFRTVLLAAAMSALLGGTAQAAPFGALKQHRVPTADSQPRAIVDGSDGNRWFTLGTEFTNAPPAIARITPSGAVTEFRPPCETCIVTDLVQGPDGVLYFSSNEAFLGRITTSTCPSRATSRGSSGSRCRSRARSAVSTRRPAPSR